MVASGAWFPAPTQADEPANSIDRQAAGLDSAAGLMAAQSGLKFLGTRSCAATACHGGVQPDTRFPLSRRNEYASWLDHDPHARSQFTLSHEASQLILQRLARDGEGDDDRARRLANCLACHNPQPSVSQQAATFYRYDGVSCEVCHGAAEKWIGAHVEAGWRAVSADDSPMAKARRREVGFIETRELTVRGQTCVQCHVGSPGREVNHDLIAAGHPVLKFEFAAYHELLPKHWREDAALRNDPRQEAKLWSAGQIAAADAALSLLQWRSDAQTAKHPDAAWPELAEYDCFACHHDLEDPSWRRQRTLADLPLGMPAWGTWYFGPLRQMHNATAAPGQGLAALTARMQHGFGGDRSTLPAVAQGAREQLQRWSEAASLDDVSNQMRRALKESVVLAPLTVDIAPHRDSQPTGWDEAVQLYLAIIALDSPAKKIDAAKLTAMRSLLAFPDEFDSPRGFLGTRPPGTLPGDEEAANPRQPTRQRVVAALAELVQQLESSEDVQLPSPSPPSPARGN